MPGESGDQFKQAEYYKDLTEKIKSKSGALTDAELTQIKTQLPKIEWTVGADGGEIVKTIKEKLTGIGIDEQKALLFGLQVASQLAPSFDVDTVTDNDRILINTVAMTADINIGEEFYTDIDLKIEPSADREKVHAETRAALEGVKIDVIKKSHVPYNIYEVLGRTKDFVNVYEQDFNTLSSDSSYGDFFTDAGDFDANSKKTGNAMMKALKKLATEQGSVEDMIYYLNGEAAAALARAAAPRSALAPALTPVPAAPAPAPGLRGLHGGALDPAPAAPASSTPDIPGGEADRGDLRDPEGRPLALNKLKEAFLAAPNDPAARTAFKNGLTDSDYKIRPGPILNILAEIRAKLPDDADMIHFEASVQYWAKKYPEALAGYKLYLTKVPDPNASTYFITVAKERIAEIEAKGFALEAPPPEPAPPAAPEGPKDLKEAKDLITKDYGDFLIQDRHENDFDQKEGYDYLTVRNRRHDSIGEIRIPRHGTPSYMVYKVDDKWNMLGDPETLPTPEGLVTWIRANLATSSELAPAAPEEDDVERPIDLLGFQQLLSGRNFDARVVAKIKNRPSAPGLFDYHSDNGYLLKISGGSIFQNMMGGFFDINIDGKKFEMHFNIYNTHTPEDVENEIQKSVDAGRLYVRLSEKPLFASHIKFELGTPYFIHRGDEYRMEPVDTTLKEFFIHQDGSDTAKKVKFQLDTATPALIDAALDREFAAPLPAAALAPAGDAAPLPIYARPPRGEALGGHFNDDGQFVDEELTEVLVEDDEGGESPDLIPLDPPRTAPPSRAGAGGIGGARVEADAAFAEKAKDGAKPLTTEQAMTRDTLFLKSKDFERHVIQDDSGRYLFFSGRYHYPIDFGEKYGDITISVPIYGKIRAKGKIRDEKFSVNIFDKNYENYAGIEKKIIEIEKANKPK
ncbi:MAG: hypothetical protein AAB588_00005 [Patescibacteria group bacterium]